jgi:hypothetical protein
MERKLVPYLDRVEGQAPHLTTRIYHIKKSFTSVLPGVKLWPLVASRPEQRRKVGNRATSEVESPFDLLTEHILGHMGDIRVCLSRLVILIDCVLQTGLKIGPAHAHSEAIARFGASNCSTHGGLECLHMVVVYRTLVDATFLLIC